MLIVGSGRIRSQRLVYGPILAVLLVTWAVVLTVGAQAAIASPVVDELQPNHGPEAGGTAVTILGSGFSGATAVNFGLREAESFTVNSDTSITAVSPPAGDRAVVDVMVTTPDGGSVVGPQDQFGYGPVVGKITPRRGPAVGGTSVTISGFGLEGATGVNFGPAPAASFSENPDGSITAVSPPVTPGENVVSIVVLTPEGESHISFVPDTTPPNAFTYGPTITSVEPSSGSAAGGTKVAIHGSGFQSLVFLGLIGPFNSSVDFGSTELTCGTPRPLWIGPCGAAQFEVRSDSEIVATAPPGEGTVPIRVETRGGISPETDSDSFTYIPVSEVPGTGGAGGSGPASASRSVQLVSCRTAAAVAAKASHRRRGASRAAKHVCTSRLVPGPVRAGTLSARLAKGGLLYGVGTAAVSPASARLALRPLRQILPGRYRLTLISPHGSRREALTIR